MHYIHNMIGQKQSVYVFNTEKEIRTQPSLVALTEREALRKHRAVTCVQGQC